MYFVFDLDGTLSDQTHRQPLIDAEKQDWDAYYAAAHADPVIKPIAMIARSLSVSGHRVEIWTGRSDVVREETAVWLFNHGIMYHRLRMREHGDHTPDYSLKLEWLNNLKYEGLPKPDAVFEDRTRVVEMYRAVGIPCLQVAKGDY
jgi:hypothetical protein